MSENGIVFFLNTNGVFLLVLLAMGYLWFFARERTEGLKVLLSVLMAGVMAIFLKELFGQPRPFMVSGMDASAGWGVFSSFPSFHSAIAFSAATTVSFQRRRFGMILLFLAFLVGVGRIIARVHYPIDVIFGIVIGVTIAMFVEGVNVPLRKK